MRQPQAWSDYADRYGLDEAAMITRLAIIGSVIDGAEDTLSEREKAFLGQIARQWLDDDTEYISIKGDPRINAAQEVYIKTSKTPDAEKMKRINHFTEGSVFYGGLLVVVKLRALANSK